MFMNIASNHYVKSLPSNQWSQQKLYSEFVPKWDKLDLGLDFLLIKDKAKIL